VNHHTIIFNVTNPNGFAMEVHIEPWGWPLTVAPEAQIEVQMTGPADGKMEFEWTAQGLIIWGWKGSTFRVLQDSQLLCDSDVPLPADCPTAIRKLIRG
jgi:hypothetical protein